MTPLISVRNLTKTYTYSVKNPTKGIIANFFHPDKKQVHAVNDLSFDVQKGETLAFIGPNGAGKSTTIKILTGILFPTSGDIQVAGMNPQTERRQLSFSIGTVFSQRSQLLWNLPARDSFTLFGKMYELPEQTLKRRINTLIERFQIADVVDQPVRKLSLGQRMRCEIALSLVHKPTILFLDEPTVGLDVVAKRALRQTLRDMNRDEQTTIFLTSHDTGDIEALCDRTIIVNHGKIVLDQPTDDLRRTVLTKKDIRIELKDATQRVKLASAKVLKQEDAFVTIQVDTNKHPLNSVLEEILAKYPVEDMDVSSASLEEIIETVYQQHP